MLISDRPGELARLFAAAGSVGVNIEDIRIDHSPGREAGLVELVVDPAVADRLASDLGGLRLDGPVLTGTAAG